MVQEHDPAELRAATCELARLGSQTARAFFGKVDLISKDDATPVTQADYATQEAILAEIAQRFPGHAVIVEEHVVRPERHASRNASDYCWTVDPIDGTRNFGRGVGAYAVSVAVLHRGRPVAGAIFDATTEQVYSASLGGGAYRERQRLTLPDRPLDINTTVAISSFRRRSVPPTVRNWMDQYNFRNYGSVCLHMAWVAAGLMDAAYALECKLWDVAAGALLIEEAGGIVTNHLGRVLWPKDLLTYGGEDVPILGATRRMHGILLDALEQAGGRR